MDTKERAKWLKWSKLGICVSQQGEQPEEFNMEKSLEKLLKRQQEKWKENLMLTYKPSK